MTLCRNLPSPNQYILLKKAELCVQNIEWMTEKILEIGVFLGGIFKTSGRQTCDLKIWIHFSWKRKLLEQWLQVFCGDRLYIETKYDFFPFQYF